MAQVAIAWVMAQGADIVPLTGGDIAAIEHAVPKGAAAGDRYPAQATAHLDGERA